MSYKDIETISKDWFISRAHLWNINSDNSGKCSRCGYSVSSVKEIEDDKRCTPHWEDERSGYLKE